MTGHVYFVQFGATGPIKVGVASNVRKRLIFLQNGSPERLYVRALIPGDAELEKKIHADLRPHRIRGEWYRPVDEVKLWFHASVEIPADLAGRKDIRRGGRKKGVRLPEAEALVIWRSLEYPEDWQALQHMTGWTQRTAYRWLGPRGLRVGRPRKQ